MSESISKEWPALAGSVVKVGGIPYALKEDAVLIGCMEPDWSWTKPSNTGDADGTASSEPVTR